MDMRRYTAEIGARIPEDQRQFLEELAEKHSFGICEAMRHCIAVAMKSEA